MIAILGLALIAGLAYILFYLAVFAVLIRYWYIPVGIALFYFVVGVLSSSNQY